MAVSRLIGQPTVLRANLGAPASQSMFWKKQQPFPKWMQFSESASKWAIANAENLGPGDAVAVRFHGRVLPMDLLRATEDGVVVQDPDHKLELHDWSDVWGYWKRIN